MAVINLYSKSQKAIRGEVPEIFIYDIFPDSLRKQITLILNDAFGEYKGYRHGDVNPDKILENIHSALCREYGVDDLGFGNGYSLTGREYLNRHILYCKDVEKVLDVVQICCRVLTKYIKENDYDYKQSVTTRMEPDEAIEELNVRFKENGVGYQFVSNEIIRIDSTLMHNEVTKPTLTLLHNSKFAGANEEYLKAHEHYRHGRNKECLNECLKAFESTLKIICKEKGWSHSETDTAKKLIQICFQNELVPTFTQNQFTSLQNLIESGIPSIRNKVGGHGQGQTPKPVSDGMTRYGLNLTGSNIIFLIEQSEL